MINPMDLTGKHFLVTGASQGIGKTTAIHLSQLGAKVCLMSRNGEKLQDTLQSMEDCARHSLYPFDLKKIDDIESVLNNIVAKEGKFNGFVHCAGVVGMRPLQQTTYQAIHDDMLINFYSFIELSRLISKKKNRIENSSFVAISSVASTQGIKSKTSYCSSKGALDSAIRSMAKELAVKKIRVNSVVPGFVKTELYDAYLQSAGEKEFEKNVLPYQYLGLGEPIDVANAIAFLLSDASKFITGTGLVVDGGYLS